MENIVKDKNNEFVKLVNVNKIYNKKVHAVYDFNLDIKKNEFIVFVGPSGCGKSTTLRMIAGLEEISSGELYIDGVLSNDALPKERDVAMVFQSYALYPNMTVFENMAFALEVQHLPKEEIQNRVNKAAKILQLEDYLHRKPKALSGGQRQRVALGRAIVRNARLFLMDEPLSNLDAKLRVQMRTEITKIHKQINTTTIYVTHDQTEAMTMADRIVVMKDGYIQQIGTPYEIYMNPTNQFVASFIGSPAMNMIEATYDNGILRFDNGYEFKLSKKQIELHTEFYKKRINELESDLEDAQKIIEDNVPTLKKRLSLFKKKSKDKKQNKSKDEIINEIQNEINKVTEINSGASHKLIFGVRPESIKRVSESIKESQKYKIKICELLGDEYYVHFEFGGNDFLAKVPSETRVSVDDDINFVIDNDKTYIFDIYSGKTIK